MYAAAQLIAFTAGNISFHAHAFADIRAVFSATRRTDIAGGDHFIIFYDHSAVVTSKACAALGNGLSQIQIVVRFISFAFAQNRRGDAVIIKIYCSTLHFELQPRFRVFCEKARKRLQ